VCVCTREIIMVHGCTIELEAEMKKKVQPAIEVCIYSVHTRTRYIIYIIYNTKAAYSFGGHKRWSEEDGHDRSCTSIQEHDRRSSRHSCIDLDFLVHHLL